MNEIEKQIYRVEGYVPQIHYPISYARAKHEYQLRKQEAEARKSFEQKLKAEKEKARRTFEESLRKKLFAPDLTKEEKIQRQKLKAEIEKKKQKAIRKHRLAIIKAKKEFIRKLRMEEAKAKREYAIRYKKQLSPRDIAFWRSQQFAVFQSNIQKEEEAFKKELKSWEQKAKEQLEQQIGKWKSSRFMVSSVNLLEWKKAQEDIFYTQLGKWEKRERSKFELDLKRWKESEIESFEKQIADWKVKMEQQLRFSGLQLIHKRKLQKLTPKGVEEAKAKKSKKVDQLPPIKESSILVVSWTPEGLQRKLHGKPEVKELEPKSLTDIIYETEVPNWRLPLSQFDIQSAIREKKGLPPEPPLSFLAGVVASAESFVYTLANLIGIKTPEVPVAGSGLLASGKETLESRKPFWEIKPKEHIKANITPIWKKDHNG